MRRHALIPGILMAAAPLVSAAAPAEEVKVASIRHWSAEDATRVIIETTGGFKYRSDTLHEPERVFFDLAGVRPRTPIRGIQTIPVGDKFLKRIRVAETQPGRTRVVLDLEERVVHTASVDRKPDRLIIELRVPRPAPTAPAEKPLTQLGPEPAAAPKTEVAVAKTESPPAPAVRPEVKSAPPPARPARRIPGAGTTLTRALGLKMARVAIDPGHGGNDHGSTGPGGLIEKELVLDVAKRLGELVEERMGAEVVYTRADDTFIPLEGRTELANEKKADLFISIHANSSPYASVLGVETYYLNLTTSREAMDLAARENATSRHGIHDLGDLIQKIARNDKVAESREFAAKMQAALYSLYRATPSVRNRGVKKAPFIVLIGATMPSILAEIGFLSNPREEAILKRPEQRQKLAEALYRGLSRYAETLSHLQVARAKD
ncbi:MAG: N-acetylmuramoyl-L-alanine amidase [Acidobacteria bacterium]|nr:N-acetylmuramoyl-L-alanine amidase [Acidobacteriota bacterium]